MSLGEDFTKAVRKNISWDLEHPEGQKSSRAKRVRVGNNA